MSEHNQMSESFLLGSVLAVVGGFLDAYTYICRGGVFANAETGNIVLMGIKLAQGEFKNALLYLIPILAFASGIIIAEIIKKHNSKNKYVHWRQIVITVEILVMIVVSFIPQGELNVIANVLVSFTCALQVQTFRKVNGNTYATTMCTGNLRSGTANLYKFTQTKDKNNFLNALQYYGIIFLFICGAVIGSFITKAFDIKAILFSCLGLLVAFILMFINPNKKPSSIR